MRPLNVSQRLEITGLAAILLSLFIQFFGLVYFEGEAKHTNDLILEERLNHIYSVAAGQGERLPGWDQIEDQFGGKPFEAKGLGFRISFEFGARIAAISAALLFLIGSVLTVWGKLLEYDELKSR